MKERTDFVSNSSTSSFMVPIDGVNHDSSKWLKNSLRVQPDTKRIMMEFSDFENDYEWGSENNAVYNWKFLCTQFMYWVCPELLDRTPKTKKKLIRQIHNSEEFIRINDYVKSYINFLGIECEGIEFDEEDIRVVNIGEDEPYTVCEFIPECRLNHESIYDGIDDMLKEANCTSIPELIWGIKKIGFNCG